MQGFRVSVTLNRTYVCTVISSRFHHSISGYTYLVKVSSMLGAPLARPDGGDDGDDLMMMDLCYGRGPSLDLMMVMTKSHRTKQYSYSNSCSRELAQ